MYDHQAKKLNEQGTFKEIVVEISARQLSAKSETLRQMSMFLTQAVFMEVCVHPKPGLVTRHGGLQMSSLFRKSKLPVKI